MFKIKKAFQLFLLVLPLMAEAGEVTVTSVAAQQRYPWNGLVDITVTLQGTADDMAVTECSFAAMNNATKAAIPVRHVTRNGDDSGSGNVWTRKFIWDAKADVGAVKIDDVALTVDTFVGVQLWENGPYWATCNVGASQPEESGYYFWWGDTIGYKRNASNNGWVSVKDETGFTFSSGNCPTHGKSNSQLQSEGCIDAAGNLVAAYDAATAHLDEPWRMPTHAEFGALFSNCTTTWTNNWNGMGVNGRLVTGKGAYSSRSIFLPAAGCGSGSSLDYPCLRGFYWFSTSRSEAPTWAWGLDFASGYIYGSDDCGRYNGRTVRPVRRFANVNRVNSGVMTHLTIDCRIIMGVTARQRYPWNGFVDVTVTLQGEAEDLLVTECTFAAMNSATKTAISVEHITRNGDDSGDGNVWIRKFVWDAKADVGAVKIDDVVLAVDAFVGVQLWENGPYWAKCNVGATKPESSGYYFWWGDTVGYTQEGNIWNAVDGSWIGFSFNSENCPTRFKNTSDLQSLGYIDETGNLVDAHDAATAHLGAPWRIPTDAEFLALVSNCTTIWTNNWNGMEVNGRLVTGKGAYSSRSIFLPAAGEGCDSDLGGLGSRGTYWSSTPDAVYSPVTWCLSLNSSNFRQDCSDRYYGYSVRPVRGLANNALANGGLITHLSLDCRDTQIVEPIPALPENPTAGDVQSALAGSADSKLLANVTDAGTYNAYREWALKIGAAEVKASPFAWVSFATDSAALLTKMPTDDDLKVDEFKPSATAGSFDFMVSVTDVTIGDKASEGNLKKLFGLEGAESLDSAAFSSENVSLDFKELQDGKLKFTATPAVDNAKSFFMKVKVK